jgi:hypothetical protein
MMPAALVALMDGCERGRQIAAHSAGKSGTPIGFIARIVRRTVPLDGSAFRG